MTKYLILCVLALAAQPAWAQTFTGTSNKIGNQQHVNTIITTRAVEGQTTYQDTLIQQRRAYLKELQDRALNLVAVERQLRCCQLIGVTLPWNDAKTFVNTTKGTLFLQHDAGTETDKAAIDVKNKNTAFSQQEIADILRLAKEKEAQQQPFLQSGGDR
ncbi:MAG: hypothetical protein GC134_08030 [Proteobacteria bacterium]|nr:hypothetical protein [Pseudomonadota bacterium]